VEKEQGNLQRLQEKAKSVQNVHRLERRKLPQRRSVGKLSRLTPAVVFSFYISCLYSVLVWELVVNLTR